MAIFRHSRVALTMEIYTEVPDQAARDALGKLSSWLDQADEPPTSAPQGETSGPQEQPAERGA